MTKIGSAASIRAASGGGGASNPVHNQIKHKPVDLDDANDALDSMYEYIRKADAAIAEVENMGARMEGASGVTQERFPAAFKGGAAS